MCSISYTLKTKFDKRIIGYGKSPNSYSPFMLWMRLTTSYYYSLVCSFYLLSNLFLDMDRTSKILRTLYKRNYPKISCTFLIFLKKNSFTHIIIHLSKIQPPFFNIFSNKFNTPKNPFKIAKHNRFSPLDNTFKINNLTQKTNRKKCL